MSKSSKSTKSSKSSSSKSSKRGKSIDDGVSYHGDERQRQMRAADTAFFTDTVLDEFQLDTHEDTGDRQGERRTRGQQRYNRRLRR